MRQFTKATILATTGGLALNPAANAVILWSGDLSGANYIANDSNVYIDFDTMSASNSTIAGYDVSFESKVEDPTRVVGFNGWTIAKSTSQSTDWTWKFSEGDAINVAGWSPTTMNRASDLGLNDSNWPTSGFGYVGMGNGTASAWVLVNFTASGNLPVQILEFAYDDTGTMTIGQVPEPSAAVLAAALLAGSAVAFRNRRRMSL